MLYLYPKEGFNENSDIWLSQLSENLISGTNVSNVTFKNLKMESSRAGVIRIKDAKNITVENCEIIADTGTNGVYLSGNGKCNGKETV